MTLLISSLRRTDVLLTADGRSTLTQGGVVTGFRDQTQKLFPIPGHPAVICQHGQNILHGHAIGQIINNFCRELPVGMGIRDISDQLAEALHAEVRDALRRLGPETAAGVWVVGYGRGEDEPEHCEVFWKYEGDQFVARESRWRACDIILGGDGKLGLVPDVADIEQASLLTVQSLHAKFMDHALHADVKPNSVGGHVHEAVIRPWGWEWTLPPLPGA